MVRETAREGRGRGRMVTSSTLQTENKASIADSKRCTNAHGHRGLVDTRVALWRSVASHAAAEVEVAAVVNMRDWRERSPLGARRETGVGRRAHLRRGAQHHCFPLLLAHSGSCVAGLEVSRVSPDSRSGERNDRDLVSVIIRPDRTRAVAPRRRWRHQSGFVPVVREAGGDSVEPRLPSRQTLEKGRQSMATVLAMVVDTLTHTRRSVLSSREHCRTQPQPPPLRAAANDGRCSRRRPRRWSRGVAQATWPKTAPSSSKTEAGDSAAQTNRPCEKRIPSVTAMQARAQARAARLQTSGDQRPAPHMEPSRYTEGARLLLALSGRLPRDPRRELRWLSRPRNDWLPTVVCFTAGGAQRNTQRCCGVSGWQCSGESVCVCGGGHPRRANRPSGWHQHQAKRAVPVPHPECACCCAAGSPAIRPRQSLAEQGSPSWLRGRPRCSLQKALRSRCCAHSAASRRHLHRASTCTPHHASLPDSTTGRDNA